MNEHRHDGVGDLTARRRQLELLGALHDLDLGSPRQHVLTISCDDCAQQCTAACDDCVVTHVLRHADEAEPVAEVQGMVLDVEEARVVRMMTRAGLVPDLKFEVAG